MNLVSKNPKKQQAIELSAFSHGLTQKEIAKKLDIPYETLSTWRRNPNFHIAIYERYMSEFESELPGILKAMISEANAGNVQAARLILEHSGKLIKNLHITTDSPSQGFERWLKARDAEEAEIVEDVEVIELIDTIPDIQEELPPRVVESAQERILAEKKAIKSSIKREEYNRKQKDWYKWKKRAKAVGIEPLSAKRPTKGQRTAWEDEIIKKEKANERKNS